MLHEDTLHHRYPEQVIIDLKISDPLTVTEVSLHLLQKSLVQGIKDFADLTVCQCRVSLAKAI